MTEPQVPAPLLHRLGEAERALIVSHEEPDGDCVASSLALASALSRNGTEVHQFNVGPFDRGEIQEYETHFAGHIPERLQTPERGTVVVMLDCSTPDRVGSLRGQIERHPVLVIDHHPTEQKFGEEAWIVPESPSTTYLVQLVIEGMGMTPTKREAEYIMFGFGTDTGFFRHLMPHQGFAFHGLARLAECGVSPRTAHELMYGGRTLASRRLIGKLLHRMESHYGGRLLATWESMEDTAEVGKANRDSDAFYELVFAIGDCEALIYLRQESPGRCTGSLRSRDRIDVSVVASEFGGGGHRNAAGFLAEGTSSSLLPRVIGAFADQFAERENIVHAESR